MFENSFINTVARFYSWIIWLGESLQSLFLLVLRLTWGQQFFLTGLGKFLNHEAVVQYYTTLGLLHPSFHAYLVATLELLCGALLFAGLAARLAAIPLILTTFSALIVHNVFEGLHFISNPSLLVHSAPFPYLMTALIIFVFGPGRFSMDAWIKRKSRYWNQL